MKSLIPSCLSRIRATEILNDLVNSRVLVVGDVILDRYVWGSVQRISPEAPVPILHYSRETAVPGGAANVARNLAELEVPVTLAGTVGCDESGACIKRLLDQNDVGIDGILEILEYRTSTKTRFIASRQQLLRVDREEPLSLSQMALEGLKTLILQSLAKVKAVIVADYAKGVVTQEVLDFIKQECKRRGIWLSVDPKPSHSLDLSQVNLITPNRKEAFELAKIPDPGAPLGASPLEDEALGRVVERLLQSCAPAHILITLGEQGMLLCQNGLAPIHIPTVAREVFDVSGAGDTVIATLTAALTTGASLEEAAVLANHAAGVVVAKVGTATVTPDEILQTIRAD